MQPRRSVLYMPGANTRAMEKAQSIDCDTIIFDLEDAVAADAKQQARQQVVQAITGGSYGYRELIVRANGLESPWGADDVRELANLPIQGMLFPKVESPVQVEEILHQLDLADAHQMPIWLMIETPTGVLNVRDTAAVSDRIRCLVIGTSDLVTDIRGQHTPGRNNIAYALQHCVLVARERGLDILDGVHLDFRNLESLRVLCEQGRAMGFDGKTLIHPTQVAAANEVFGLTAEAVAHAEELVAVWQQAQQAGRGVVELNGQLIENLHVVEAERTLAFHAALLARG